MENLQPFFLKKNETNAGLITICYDEESILSTIKDKIRQIKNLPTNYTINESDNLATDLDMSSMDKYELFDYLMWEYDLLGSMEIWSNCSTVRSVKDKVLSLT